MKAYLCVTPSQLGLIRTALFEYYSGGRTTSNTEAREQAWELTTALRNAAFVADDTQQCRAIINDYSKGL